ncbi:Uncharacterised protein [uncultured archaeon]|nr:Uncharacterised protein [uncultured archaeon]
MNEVSKAELEEIEQLIIESLNGEHVRWEELKKELSL